MESIIIQAAAEDVEILNDSAHTKSCTKCGTSIMVAGSFLLDGQLKVMASNQKTESCPKCGTPISLG